MTKLIISSDYHLSFNAPFNRITPDGRSTRIDEILESILWVSEEGKQHGAEYFISLGDMFEKADKLLTREGNHIKDCLAQVSSQYGKNKHIALRGNHCSINENYSIVNLFSDTLTPINTPTFLDVDGGRLFFCPYQRESEDIYNTLGSFEKKDCIGNKYLFGHFWTSDVMAVDSDAIDLDKFNYRFYNRILCGHYHKPSESDDNLITYVGTLLNKSFSETGPKGCWLLDTVSNKIEFIRNPHSPEFFSTEDSAILSNPTTIDSNSYYKVATSAENITHISRLLEEAKGFELVCKTDSTSDDSVNLVSIDTVEKNNSLTLRDFIFKNATLYCPDNIDLESFVSKGKELLGGL